MSDYTKEMSEFYTKITDQVTFHTIEFKKLPKEK